VLTTATFVVTGRIPVDLAASTQAAPAQPPTRPLVLTYTRDKHIYLNDLRVQQLEQALAPFARGQTVTVRADGALALTDFVTLVDRVKALGFEKVALEVRRT
jgi:biopolymer transport protein ExbD